MQYQPTVADIILVKKSLASLPIELIDGILDEASYWPHSSLTIAWRDSVPSQRRNSGGDKMYMRTLPLAIYGTDINIALPARRQYGGEYPARKVIFELWSKDQGWSNEIANRGTYNGSSTWFDADVETLRHFGSEHPFLPSPTHLQRNIHAKNKVHHHTVVWHYLDSIEEGSTAAFEAEARGQGWKSLNGTFVRSLKVGDCITLWMRARFPTRRLDITKAKISVYWAV
ncbi:hypothetical protein BJ138DRAFT_1136435 [Hygrophoropsis aurantiaca]|uniref:Uncharacterized protein n=1 Tax=Hygrophoropsis aurantiaca TaxID=72124 RepID=A0ACB8A9J1_9AGAM|nr:hypothetical protein BJ138DRAFT_1136435 [Hygrophoropsis aurantiaca]